MNIFIKLSYSAVLLCILFSSCSKDNAKTDEPIAEQPACKVASFSTQWYLEDRSGTSVNKGFAFDSQDRVILAPIGNMQISFEYYGDQIILKYANEAPNTVTDYYTLNDKKQITHLVRKAMNTFRGDKELKDYLVLDFLYDKAGYLIAIKEGDKQSTFTYTDGNLTNISDELKDENANYTFSYNEDEIFKVLPLAELSPIYHMRSLHRIPTPASNPFGMAILTAGGYFGKLPKNQIKSIGTYKFSYTKNDKKQISKLKSANSDDSVDSTIYKFDYLCR